MGNTLKCTGNLGKVKVGFAAIARGQLQSQNRFEHEPELILASRATTRDRPYEKPILVGAIPPEGASWDQEAGFVPALARTANKT